MCLCAPSFWKCLGFSGCVLPDYMMSQDGFEMLPASQHPVVSNARLVVGTGGRAGWSWGRRQVIISAWVHSNHISLCQTELYLPSYCRVSAFLPLGSETNQQDQAWQQTIQKFSSLLVAKSWQHLLYLCVNTRVPFAFRQQTALPLILKCCIFCTLIFKLY